ncbi:hypothetical protein LSP04_20870 [Levilactobacillus spicheri]|uniref:Uncharacterized protein n=1 Tax=Levilactobacillus spicheri TaxID=216463 RepID=A0ABQ0WRE5_9LACO|nr:hypothetical protein LSP04_20870 [Levilactobacillus spicheri]
MNTCVQFTPFMLLSTPCERNRGDLPVVVKLMLAGGAFPAYIKAEFWRPVGVSQGFRIVPTSTGLLAGVERLPSTIVSVSSDNKKPPSAIH